MTEARFCSSCGSPLPSGAHFCANCGESIPTPVVPAGQPQDPAPAPAPAPAPEVTQPVAPVQSPPVQSPPVQPPSPPSSSSNTGLLVGIGVVVALLLAIVVIFLISSGGDGDDSTSANGGDGSSESASAVVALVVTDVATADQRLEGRLAELQLTDSAFGRARDAGKDLQRAVSQAQSQLDDSEPTADEQDLVDAADAWLGSQSELADAVVALPNDPYDFSDTDVEKLSGRASDMDDAATSLENAMTVAPEMPLTSSDFTRLSPLAERAMLGRDEKEFVIKMESLLNQSTQGRGEISQTISGVMDHCKVPPDEASHSINSVADNRQSLLDQAAALAVPDSRNARNAIGLFSDAMQHSIEADRHFAKWMDHLFVYYYTFPVGCPGRVPTNAEYDQAVADSNQADQAKVRFVRVFNAMAREYGERSNWKSSQI